uniref:Uncharacterized protein n=1 Tax=Tanacetum cinerariifolium TaxID=118510 RepID=A0A699I0M2_TANCI|nr:hypothetical protein [Tanacetum cinerariifolium]
MAFVVNSVLAYGVDHALEKKFASFALQVLKIHSLMNSLMNQLRILTMILQNLSTHHYSPRHTLVSYVETIITTERTIPLRDIISQLPSSIVITTSSLVLPIKDPEDSHIMGKEELSTILEKESDEFIKSSRRTFDDESLSDEDVPKENIKIYSNPLFEFDDKVTTFLLHRDPSISVAFILEGFTDEPPLEEQISIGLSFNMLG